MGCVSANTYEPTSFDSKVLIWMIGGGPGAPKHHVSTFLTEQYQFKYLSVLELIHFEEKANSPEATEIRKNMEEKKEYSASLIIKVIKKFFTSYGSRKYLLDNFPRNQKDAQELDQFCRKYSAQVEMQGYIQVQLQEQQMREDGIKALKQMKKEETDQSIQKQVRTIIQSYRAKTKPLLQYYRNKSLLGSFPFLNSDVNLLNNNIAKYLASKNITAVRNVSFYLINANNTTQLQKSSLIMSRKFGLKYWSIQQLVQQLKEYPETAKQVAGKKEDQVDGTLLVEMMIRKLRKYNFKGKYLISGFPRNQADFQTFQAKFGGQVKLQLHFSFLKTPATQKEEQEYTKLNKRLVQVEQINSKMILSAETPLQQLYNCIDKTLPSVKKRKNLKVGLFPSIENRGQQYAKKLMEWCQVIDFNELLKQQVKKDRIYSDLINSTIALDKPLSGVIYSQVFREKIQHYKGTKPLVFRNVLQNLQQLKMLLEKSVEVEVLFGLFSDFSQAKDEKSSWRGSEYKSVCQQLVFCCDKTFPINVKSTYQELKAFIDSL